jgi:NAD(P)-dependent dehydrogenase (short-subunit alcohol dehydrogenase family)
MAPGILEGSVVIVTGASSGFGRAAARRFAEQGDAVVAVARREAPLRELVAEIERGGGRAVAVPADVRDEDAMHGVAARALQEYGGLDVWVSNAGVTAFGDFVDVPTDVFRGVMETNFFGMVNGARAALPRMVEQGHGVLINMASVVGEVGPPKQSAYAASKWAIRGFSESLRQELRGTGVHVSVVMPGPFDTPIWQHAANYTGRRAQALRPTGDPERVAATLVRLARRPRREVIVGRGAAFQAFQHRLTPGLTEWATGRLVEHDNFTDEPQPPTEGNVLVPVPFGTTVEGGWRDARARRLAVAVAGGAVAAGVGAAVRGRRLFGAYARLASSAAVATIAAAASESSRASHVWSRNVAPPT